jgi:hypothetical protein
MQNQEALSEKRFFIAIARQCVFTQPRPIYDISWPFNDVCLNSHPAPSGVLGSWAIGGGHQQS